MRICTSIVVEELSKASDDVNVAFKAGSDLIELRLDRYPQISKGELRKWFGAVLDRCVITFRSRREGGFYSGDEDSRIRTIVRLSTLNPGYIDLELFAARETPEAVSKIRESKSRLIISCHFLKETPTVNAMKARLREMWCYSDHAKIVTYAKRFGDNLRIMSLYPAEAGRFLIGFSMGELGLPSRFLAPYLGSPFTYACLGAERVAPGQVSVKELRRMYDMLQSKS